MQAGRRGHRLSRRACRTSPILRRDENKGAPGGSPARRPVSSTSYHLERLAWMDELVACHGIRRALTVADLPRCARGRTARHHRRHRGARLPRGQARAAEESYQRGVRTMQLVHYTPNDIGDFQTGAVVHNGLTPFGADVIRACNRAPGWWWTWRTPPADTVKQAARGRHHAAAALAHRAARLEGAGADAAHRAPDHAGPCPGDRGRRAGPSGSGTSSRAREGYVDGLKEMVDVVGVDHVSIGSDHPRAQRPLQRATTTSPRWWTRCCRAASRRRRPPRSSAATTCGSSRPPPASAPSRRGRSGGGRGAGGPGSAAGAGSSTRSVAPASTPPTPPRSGSARW